jgi:hypothetical protein
MEDSFEEPVQQSYQKSEFNSKPIGPVQSSVPKSNGEAAAHELIPLVDDDFSEF